MLGFFPALLVRRTALFDLGVAEIDQVVEILDLALDVFGDLDYQLLNQRRPADRLLHPELPALHFAGEGDFTIAGQKGYGAHFAQVNANGIVRVDRFFYWCASLWIFGVLLFWMKKCCIVVKRNAKRLCRVAYILIFKMIHFRLTSPL